jgi:hypothetical protein
VLHDLWAEGANFAFASTFELVPAYRGQRGKPERLQSRPMPIPDDPLGGRLEHRGGSPFQSPAICL